MGLDLNRIIKAAKNTDLVLTPRYNDWLMQHGDEALSERVATMIYNLLIEQPRDRSRSFSASSAGLCERRQVLKFLGMPEVGTIDPRLQNIFNDGKWRHLRWQANLLMADLVEDIEDPLFWRKMKARATPDARGIVPHDHPKPKWRGLEFGFELKGVGAYVYPKYVKGEDGEMKDEHARQVAFNCLLGGYDLYVIIYENKGTNEWFEWVIEPDEDLMAEQKEELLRLNGSLINERLPKMLPQCKAQIGPTFNECPFGGKNGPCARAGNWPALRK